MKATPTIEPNTLGMKHLNPEPPTQPLDKTTKGTYLTKHGVTTMKSKPKRNVMNNIAKKMLGISTAFALSVLSLNGASAGVNDSTHVTPVTASSANAIVATTDHLFWTLSGLTDGPSHAAGVYRISKQAPYHSDEQQLYKEKRNTSIRFNSLVYAEVDGIPYIYFVTNFDDKISYIKRVPADGGAAAFVTRVPYIAERDLKIDGSHLYWADKEGVRKVPIGGGAITILARTGTASQIGLDANFVYFNSGASGSSLYRVPKAGGAATIRAIASSPVTDLYVHESGPQTTLFWSETNAAVKGHAIGTNTTIMYQAATNDRIATSVGFDSSRVLWTDCATAGNDCHIYENEAGAKLRIYGNDDYAGNIVSDPTQLFWSQGNWIYRYIHTLPPSVSINPSPVTAVGEARQSGSLTKTATAVVANGDPYRAGEFDTAFGYSWSVDNGAFTIHYPNAISTSIYAALPACDTREGTLSVTVRDVIGRTATASTGIEYSMLLKRPGVCP